MADGVGVERVEQAPRARARSRRARAPRCAAAPSSRPRPSRGPTTSPMTQADRVAVVEPERVVPVAAHLEAADGGAVGDADLEPGRRRQRAREQALLQLLGDLLLLASRAQQLVLVAAPVGRVEHRRPDVRGLPVARRCAAPELISAARRVPSARTISTAISRTGPASAAAARSGSRGRSGRPGDSRSWKRLTPTQLLPASPVHARTSG